MAVNGWPKSIGLGSNMNNEPVAYINVEKRCLEWAKPTVFNTPIIAVMDNIPLYTHPGEHDLGIAEAIGFDKGYKAATVKELTDEEIQEISHDFGAIGWMGDTTYEFARAILRKAQAK